MVKDTCVVSRRRFLSALTGMVGGLLLPPSVFGAGKQTVAIHYAENLEPLSYSHNGTMHGILVDLMNASLKERMGYEVIHRGFPWARAQEMVMKDEGDGICTNPTEVRKRYLRFSRTPSLTIRFELFYSRANPRRSEIESIRTLEELRDFRIADVKGNSLAESIYPHDYDVFWANSPEAIMQTLDRSRRDIYIGNPLFGWRTVRTMRMDATIASRQVDIFPPSRYHLGIRKTYRGGERLVESFDKTIKSMHRDGVTDAIVGKYL